MKKLLALLLLCLPSWGAYSYYRTVTIDYTKVGGATHTDFPVLVAGTYSWLATTANGGRVQNASGYDVAFFSDSALTTQLKHETEKYTATTGEVVYWVKVPSVSHTANTTIYIAYGDSGISTDQSDAENVWDSNFKGVWHLKEDPSGSAPQMLDSTSQSNDLTSNGTMTSGDQVAAKANGGLDLEGTDDDLRINDNASVSITGALTLGVWYKMPNNPVTQAEGLASKWQVTGSWTNQRSYNLSVTTAGYLYGGVSSTGSSATAAATGSTDRVDNVWRYAAMVFVPSTSVTIYIDGVQEAQTTTSVPAALYDGNCPFIVGAQYDLQADKHPTAIVDEVRLSSAARGVEWLLGEYNSMNSPSTFYALGDETEASTARRGRAVVIGDN